MFSQAGVEVLRTKTSVSALVAMVWPGSWLTEALLTRREAELGPCKGKFKLWRVQNFWQRLSLFSCAKMRHSKSPSGRVACSFATALPRGKRRKHLPHGDLWKDFWSAHDATGLPELVERILLYCVSSEVQCSASILISIGAICCTSAFRQSSQYSLVCFLQLSAVHCLRARTPVTLVHDDD